MGEYLQKINRPPGAGTVKMPFALSIAGLDPTGGAGLLADIKAMHQQGVYGLGIISCNTIQTDKHFDRAAWVKLDFIEASLKTLSGRFAIKAVKIGAVKNRQMLFSLLTAIQQYLPSVQIVWDPVLNPTAGGHFFELTKTELAGKNAANWKAILSKCALVTPNAGEAATLCRLLGLTKASEHSKESSLDYLAPLLQQISLFTAILLKGGHLAQTTPDDWLFYYEPGTNQARQACLKTNAVARDVTSKKHGSGCVHSSIVTAQLAKGNTLQVAAHAAKAYMESFLNSSQGLLGVH